LNDPRVYLHLMRTLTVLIIGSLLLVPFGCDDSPAEREQKVDHAADKTGDVLKNAAEKTGDALNKAADSTGKVINDVADKTPRVKVDVDVTTQPSATQAMKTTTVTKTSTTTRPAASP